MKSKKSYPKEVYLNGEWLQPDEAKISVFDRGFILGDGIYEVAPFYSGKPFKLKEHLDRLQYCLNEIRIDFDAYRLENLIFEALKRAGLTESDAAVYIQVTRGVAPRTHHFPDSVAPSLLLYVFPVTLEGFEEKSWKVSVAEDFRWHRCDIKSTSLLANAMTNDEALSAGFDEQLLIRDGYFTEGSHTSIFFVKNGTIYTHPEGPEILSGITRRVVLDLCKELGIKHIETALHIDQLKEVDEIFLTGTTTQVMVVDSLFYQGKELFSGQKGQIINRLQERFNKQTRGLRH